jgi:hypothetical protein
VAKLAGKIVTESGGTHFGYREAAGGDDEDWRAEFAGIGPEHEFGRALHFGDAGAEKNLDVGSAAFRFEKVGDFVCGIVAEELAQRFFVIGDAVLFDKGDEIRRGVAGES